MRQWAGSGAGRRSRSFRQVVSDLFAMLGLETGGSDPEPAVEYLTIDGFEIEFDQTDQEDALRITAVVGLLSEDRLQRLDQMRKIMQRNLAHLRDYGVCCVIEETEDQRLLLLLRLAERYTGLRLPDLADRLGELISMAEIFREMVAAPAARVLAGGTTQAPELSEIIFRP